MIRWLSEDEIIDLVNPALKAKGWPMVNTSACRVLGAFEGDRLQQFLVLQLIPSLGPMLRVEGSDSGDTSRELAAQMFEYLIRSDARGCLTIADSPATARLCERYHLKQIESPVFYWSGIVN